MGIAWLMINRMGQKVRGDVVHMTTGGRALILDRRRRLKSLHVTKRLQILSVCVKCLLGIRRSMLGEMVVVSIS